MDEREDITMVFAKQLPQLRPALGVALVAFRLADRATGLERLGNLIVQLNTIRHHNEGPIPGNLAEDFLGEEHHREAFARALRLPEDARSSVALLSGGQCGGDGIVHAEVLVILAEHFDQSRLVLGEQREVFEQIQEA